MHRDLRDRLLRRALGELLVRLHLRARLSLALALLAAGTTPVAAEATHPLDPLTAVEHRTVFTVLDAAGHAEEDTFFPRIQLAEPAKDFVLAWEPGQPFPRRALVVVMKKTGVFEALIDLRKAELVSWTERANVQPAILLSEEFALAGEIVMGHGPWREAVEQRGLEPEAVMPIPLTVGFFGDPREREDRLVKVLAFDASEADNYWGRPIEGLVALVSLGQKRVLELVDTGPVPVPQGPVDLDPGATNPLRPSPSTAAFDAGVEAGYRVDGNQVEWDRWRFHWRVDPRVGPIVSRVEIQDGDRSRSVLYSGSLSEMFVPYTDPGPAWYFRGFLDAGEYGIGRLLSPLVPGLDCPRNATFFPVIVADEYANANPVSRAMCLFERPTGGPLWRHSEAASGATHGRRAVELVLRTVPAVGNYDYVLDWVFRLDGSLEIGIGATGVPQVKGVREGEEAWGRRIAPGTLAVDHDHFFSFRLDLDVDGRDNRVQLDALRPVALDDTTPRRSSWRVEPTVPERELAACRTIDLERPALWRVLASESEDAVGRAPSYQLVPGANAVSLFSPDSFLRRRAGFLDHHFWVTPYDPTELYAAGDYPNQNPGDTGLSSWVKRDRPIRDKDLVVWYTVGMHHVVRSEDWPAQPIVWRRFELRPFDFFARNPALDLAE